LSILRIIWRGFLLILHILLGLLLAIVITQRNPDHDSIKRTHKVANWWHGRTLRILNIDIEITGEPPVPPVLVVSNHISWLDITILGHVIPTVFLSKDEVQHWPVIGWLAKRIGTVFIKRGGGQSQAISSVIGEHLKQGGILTIFPEGTTSDGRRVKPFFSRLFAAAIESNTHVVPVGIRYHVAGEHDHLAPYIDEQSLAQNLLALMKRKQSDVEVHFDTPIDPTGHDRKRLAHSARTAILERLQIELGE